MNQEQNPDVIVPGLQIIPEINPKEEKVPVEVINGVLEEMDENWVNDIGKPYIKPGEGSGKLH